MPTKLGVILSDERALQSARASDSVDCVVLRSTLLNPPRQAASRRLAGRIHKLHPGAAVVPYAWHLVTHGVDDGLRNLGTRALPGEPRQFGRLQDTPEVRAAWDTTVQCAEALGSDQVVLRTPAGLTPGPVGVKRLRAFFAQQRERGVRLIWEAEGLWEDAELRALAREFGVVNLMPAFDVTGRLLRREFEQCWIRVDSAGATERLGSALAEELALALDEGAVSATVLFSGHRNYANLRALSALLTER